MILYFNTKIDDKTVFFNTKQKLTTFSKIAFPKNSINDFPSKYEILKTTLLSYSKIKFDACIFNIEIDSNLGDFQTIEKLILDNFLCTDISIKNTRPNTVIEWKNDLEKIKLKFGKNVNIFLCQNHDHPFVDYQTFSFERVIKSVLPQNKNNFLKCLIYSHSPDFTSICCGSRNDGVFKFNKEGNEIYKTKNVDTYFDSIIITTLETLIHVLTNLKFDGNYLGRFDWPGVKFSNLSIQYYFFPREFFRHFDGYYISTGMRCFEDLYYRNKIPFEFPKKSSIDKKIEFYYNRWKDNFMIYIRDELLMVKSKKMYYKIYKHALNSSIAFFDNTYLKEDLHFKLINNEEHKKIKYGIENKIFYNFNSLFNTLLPELVLYDRGLKYNLKRYYSSKLKYLWITSIIKFLTPKFLFHSIRKNFDKI